MTYQRLIIAAGLAMAIAACAPKAPVETAVNDQAPPETETACADDGPRFGGTGLCIGRAVNYIDPANLANDSGLPEGCVWDVNETLLPGDEALIYQAMRCDGKTTALEFRGGAHTATLGVTQSGFYETVPADHEPVRIVSLFEVPDANARILAFAREGIENAEESAACAVRPLGGDAPSDAFVVDANAAYKTKRGLKDGPDAGDVYSVCGPYGYTNDALRYWRVNGGYAFFFDLGQDLPDFNPDSLTVLKKDAEGNWGPA